MPSSALGKPLSALDNGIRKMRENRPTSPAEYAATNTMRRKSIETPDDALFIVGDPGRFHYVQFVILGLQFVTLVMSDLIPIFYNLSPQEIICSSNEDAQDDISRLPNSTHNISEDFCRCNGSVTYIYRYNQTSVISDMNLICERAPLASLATTAYFVGSALAGPLFGWLSDKYGRRPSLISSCLIFLTVNISLIFVKDYILFITLRFLAGIARVGIYSTILVLLLEWTPASRRTVMAAASEFFFPLGVIILASSAFYLREWRYIQAASAISNALFLLNVWFAPESIQWLVSNGRIQEATATIRKIARINSRPTYRTDLKAIEDLAAEQAFSRDIAKDRKTDRDYFRDPQIRKFTFLISTLWFATNFGYSGLSFLMETLTSNVAVDLSIGGALELIPCIITTFIALSCGKKYPIMIFLLLAGVLSITAGFIPSELRLRTFVALSARMSIVGSYCLMFLYAAELFPTPIRSRGFGIAFFFFMLGGMLSPQLILLRDSLFPAAPVIIVGSVSIIGALAVLALPEKSESQYEIID